MILELPFFVLAFVQKCSTHEQLTLGSAEIAYDNGHSCNPFIMEMNILYFLFLGISKEQEVLWPYNIQKEN